MKVNLCVTYACQYRCKTCNIWQRTPTDELTTDELLPFIPSIGGSRWLDVTGGEIFLRDDMPIVFDAVVELATTCCPALSDQRFSHGPDRRRRRAAQPARSRRRIVTVSLDGDEALNDEVRGIRGGFRRQVATFKALRTINAIRAVLRDDAVALQRRNVPRTFAACQREIPGLELADFHLNVAQVSDHYYGNSNGNECRLHFTNWLVISRLTNVMSRIDGTPCLCSSERFSTGCASFRRAA